MPCPVLPGYGYRRVPTNLPERPYGERMRWNDPQYIEIDADLTIEPNADPLEILIDVSQSRFGADLSRLSSLVVEVDWGDGDSFSAGIGTANYFHTYAEDGSYDVEVTIINYFGLCDSVIVPVVIDTGE